MKKLEKMFKKAVVSMIDIEIYGWPPVCIGMLYQPEKPEKKPEKTKAVKDWHEEGAKGTATHPSL